MPDPGSNPRVIATDCQSAHCLPPSAYRGGQGCRPHRHPGVGLVQAPRQAQAAIEGATGSAAGALVRHLAEASARQAAVRRTYRAHLLEQTALSAIPPAEANHQLDAMRWVDRVGYHTWRSIHHLLTTSGTDTAHHAEVYAEPETDE